MNVMLNNSINNYPLKSQNVRGNSTSLLTKNSQPSFSGLEKFSETLSERFIDNKIVKRVLVSKRFNNFLRTAIESPGVFEAFAALSVTCTARPLTISITPGAKREDKQYASAQSIASGVTGLGFAYLLYDPIKDGIDNILFKINGENIKNTFVQFYNDPKNTDLIKKLCAMEIIPSPELFKEKVNTESNIFEYLTNYIKKGNGKKILSDILTGDDDVARKEWNDLSKTYSKKINDIFDKIRFNGVKEKHHFLVHKGLSFVNNYSLKPSAAAGKTQYLFGICSKMLFFPLTAGAMIWAIPKVMRLVFPNHKKSKRTPILMAKAMTKQNVSKSTENLLSEHVVKSSVYQQFKKKPAFTNKQVSFSGLADRAEKIYEKVYKKPVASIFEKIFEKIAFSDFYSKKINHLMENASTKKYKWTIPVRDGAGKILNNADTHPIVKNLPDISGVLGSCFYIFQTIRNKEIEPERKPALCTNMAVVAIFSLLASRRIEKIVSPFIKNLKKAHKNLLGNKISYDRDDAWQCAKKLLTVTFAFRYLGPVLATPAADKLVKLFESSKPKENK